MAIRLPSLMVTVAPGYFGLSLMPAVRWKDGRRLWAWKPAPADGSKGDT